MINGIRGIRKRWLVAAAVALLSIGLMGGTVFASGGGGHHGDSDEVLDRVAELLGKTQAELDTAYATAYDEQADAKFEEYVQGWVDDGTLTSAQATSSNDWFDERPSNSGPVAIKLVRISDSDRADSSLTKLVNSGEITQDEADALSDWHDDRPYALPTSARGHSGRGRGNRH